MANTVWGNKAIAWANTDLVDRYNHIWEKYYHMWALFWANTLINRTNKVVFGDKYSHT